MPEDVAPVVAPVPAASPAPAPVAKKSRRRYIADSDDDSDDSDDSKGSALVGASTPAPAPATQNSRKTKRINDSSDEDDGDEVPVRAAAPAAAVKPATTSVRIDDSDSDDSDSGPVRRRKPRFVPHSAPAPVAGPSDLDAIDLLGSDGDDDDDPGTESAAEIAAQKADALAKALNDGIALADPSKIVNVDVDEDDPDTSDNESDETEEDMSVRRLTVLLKQCRAISRKMAKFDFVQAEIVKKEQLPTFLPPALSLKNYQLQGLNWMVSMNRIRVNGVLADEMGLGKTVQSAALIAYMQKRRGRSPRPSLVIVPASVVDNWKRELGKWCPDSPTIVYHGSAADRAAIRQKNNQRNFFGVIITTYSYFERATSKDDRKFLRRFSFEYIILDEGHCIKNPDAARTQRLMSLRSDHSLLLSGTPVQNNVNELMSILRFCMPKIFNKELIEQIAAIDYDPSNEHVTALFRKILAPFVLRRLKMQVLGELVAKKDQTDLVPMTPTQAQTYKGIIEEHKKAKASLIKRRAKHIFTELRKAANHPLLCRTHYSDPAVLRTLCRQFEATEVFGPQASLALVEKEVRKYSDFEIDVLVRDCAIRAPSFLKYALPREAFADSGKIKHLMKILPELRREGHRVLLFSQWTKILDIIQYCVYIGLFGDIKYMRLDGSTNVQERQQLVDQYNATDEYFLFLLSTKAGGLGITLTGADTVVLHDIDFNPQNDRQAQDRCHRIGQTKPVTIIRLVSQDSVDENISAISLRKETLVNKLLQEDPSNAGISLEDDGDLESEVSSILQTVLDVKEEKAAKAKAQRVQRKGSAADDVDVSGDEDDWLEQSQNKLVAKSKAAMEAELAAVLPSEAGNAPSSPLSPSGSPDALRLLSEIRVYLKDLERLIELEENFSLDAVRKEIAMEKARINGNGNASTPAATSSAGSADVIDMSGSTAGEPTASKP
eukprot:INCI16374.7.p1 GENE.INCI16374.7~~INCI16374.7.p1  ORF type:complete len:946 (-),score=200.71 INCI16374.7:226-3063(-)